MDVNFTKLRSQISLYGYNPLLILQKIPIDPQTDIYEDIRDIQGWRSISNNPVLPFGLLPPPDGFSHRMFVEYMLTNLVVVHALQGRSIAKRINALQFIDECGVIVFESQDCINLIIRALCHLVDVSTSVHSTFFAHGLREKSLTLSVLPINSDLKCHSLISMTTASIVFNLNETDPPRFHGFVWRLQTMIRFANEIEFKSIRSIACDCLSELEVTFPGLLFPLLLGSQSEMLSEVPGPLSDSQGRLISSSMNLASSSTSSLHYIPPVTPFMNEMSSAAHRASVLAGSLTIAGKRAKGVGKMTYGNKGGGKFVVSGGNRSLQFQQSKVNLQSSNEKKDKWNNNLSGFDSEKIHNINEVVLDNNTIEPTDTSTKSSFAGNGPQDLTNKLVGNANQSDTASTRITVTSESSHLISSTNSTSHVNTNMIFWEREGFHHSQNLVELADCENSYIAESYNRLVLVCVDSFASCILSLGALEKKRSQIVDEIHKKNKIKQQQQLNLRNEKYDISELKAINQSGGFEDPVICNHLEHINPANNNNNNNSTAIVNNDEDKELLKVFNLLNENALSFDTAWILGSCFLHLGNCNNNKQFDSNLITCVFSKISSDRSKQKMGSAKRLIAEHDMMRTLAYEVGSYSGILSKDFAPNGSFRLARSSRCDAFNGCGDVGDQKMNLEMNNAKKNAGYQRQNYNEKPLFLRGRNWQSGNASAFPPSQLEESGYFDDLLHDETSQRDDYNDRLINDNFHRDFDAASISNMFFNQQLRLKNQIPHSSWGQHHRRSSSNVQSSSRSSSSSRTGGDCTTTRRAPVTTSNKLHRERNVNNVVDAERNNMMDIFQDWESKTPSETCSVASPGRARIETNFSESTRNSYLPIATSTMIPLVNNNSKINTNLHSNLNISSTAGRSTIPTTSSIRFQSPLFQPVLIRESFLTIPSPIACWPYNDSKPPLQLHSQRFLSRALSHILTVLPRLSSVGVCQALARILSLLRLVGTSFPQIWQHLSHLSSTVSAHLLHSLLALVFSFGSAPLPSFVMIALLRRTIEFMRTPVASPLARSILARVLQGPAFVNLNVASFLALYLPNLIPSAGDALVVRETFLEVILRLFHKHQDLAKRLHASGVKSVNNLSSLEPLTLLRQLPTGFSFLMQALFESVPSKNDDPVSCGSLLMSDLSLVQIQKFKSLQNSLILEANSSSANSKCMHMTASSTANDNKDVVGSNTSIMNKNKTIGSAASVNCTSTPVSRSTSGDVPNITIQIPSEVPLSSQSMHTSHNNLKGIAITATTTNNNNPLQFSSSSLTTTTTTTNNNTSFICSNNTINHPPEFLLSSSPFKSRSQLSLFRILLLLIHLFPRDITRFNLPLLITSAASTSFFAAKCAVQVANVLSQSHDDVGVAGTLLWDSLVSLLVTVSPQSHAIALLALLEDSLAKGIYIAPQHFTSLTSKFMQYAMDFAARGSKPAAWATVRIIQSLLANYNGSFSSSETTLAVRNLHRLVQDLEFMIGGGVITKGILQETSLLESVRRRYYVKLRSAQPHFDKLLDHKRNHEIDDDHFRHLSLYSASMHADSQAADFLPGRVSTAAHFSLSKTFPSSSLLIPPRSDLTSSHAPSLMRIPSASTPRLLPGVTVEPLKQLRRQMNILDEGASLSSPPAWHLSSSPSYRSPFRKRFRNMILSTLHEIGLPLPPWFSCWRSAWESLTTKPWGHDLIMQQVKKMPAFKEKKNCLVSSSADENPLTNLKLYADEYIKEMRDSSSLIWIPFKISSHQKYVSCLKAISISVSTSSSSSSSASGLLSPANRQGKRGLTSSCTSTIFLPELPAADAVGWSLIVPIELRDLSATVNLCADVTSNTLDIESVLNSEHGYDNNNNIENNLSNANRDRTHVNNKETQLFVTRVMLPSLQLSVFDLITPLNIHPFLWPLIYHSITTQNTTSSNHCQDNKKNEMQQYKNRHFASIPIFKSVYSSAVSLQIPAEQLLQNIKLFFASFILLPVCSCHPDSTILVDAPEFTDFDIEEFDPGYEQNQGLLHENDTSDTILANVQYLPLNNELNQFAHLNVDSIKNIPPVPLSRLPSIDSSRSSNSCPSCSRYVLHHPDYKSDSSTRASTFDANRYLPMLCLETNLCISPANPHLGVSCIRMMVRIPPTTILVMRVTFTSKNCTLRWWLTDDINNKLDLVDKLIGVLSTSCDQGLHREDHEISSTALHEKSLSDMMEEFKDHSYSVGVEYDENDDYLPIEEFNQKNVTCHIKNSIINSKDDFDNNLDVTSHHANSSEAAIHESIHITTRSIINNNYNNNNSKSSLINPAIQDEYDNESFQSQREYRDEFVDTYQSEVDNEVEASLHHQVLPSTPIAFENETKRISSQSFMEVDAENNYNNTSGEFENNYSSHTLTSQESSIQDINQLGLISDPDPITRDVPNAAVPNIPFNTAPFNVSQQHQQHLTSNFTSISPTSSNHKHTPLSLIQHQVEPIPFDFRVQNNIQSHQELAVSCGNPNHNLNGWFSNHHNEEEEFDFDMNHDHEIQKDMQQEFFEKQQDDFEPGIDIVNQ